MTDLIKAETIIGFKEIKKAIKKDNIKEVIVANNCPRNLKNEITIPIKEFDGDQTKLGKTIGKPFPIAMVGIRK